MGEHPQARTRRQVSPGRRYGERPGVPALLVAGACRGRSGYDGRPYRPRRQDAAYPRRAPGPGVHLVRGAGEGRPSDPARGAAPSRWGGDRRDRPGAKRRPAFQGEGDRAGHHVRRPGGDRDRERSALHAAGDAQRRTQRGAGAGDRDRRRAQGHQPLHLRSADRLRQAGRVGDAPVPSGPGEHRPPEWRSYRIRRVLRLLTRLCVVHEGPFVASRSRLDQRQGRARRNDRSYPRCAGRFGIQHARSAGARRLSHRDRCSTATRGDSDWRVLSGPRDGRSIHPAGDRCRRTFRRPSGHRDRERPPAEGAARVAAAADRDRRRAQGHQPRDLRSAHGAEDAGRGGGPVVPGRPRDHRARAGRGVPPRGESRLFG
jgi:hypothetical protein